MRSRLRCIRTASATVIAMAALGLAASPATADDTFTSFGFAANPATIKPGGLVRLSSQGCAGRTITVSSGAFDAVKLIPGRPKLVRVHANARTGAHYAVNFNCGGERGATNLTIAGAPVSVAPKPSRSAVAAAPITQVPGPTTAPSISPTAAIQGGFGGSTGGIDTSQAFTGAALVAAAAGAGGLLFVRRHHKHGRHA